MEISIAEIASNAIDLYETKCDSVGHATPILLEGKPGQAKTDFIRHEIRQRLASHYDCPVSVLIDVPSQRDPMDYRGFMVPTKVQGGTPESIFTKPDLVSRIEKLDGYNDGIVILFMDELLQADHLTQKVLTDLFLNYRLGEWVLPPNVWVISATNTQQDGAGVNRALTILTNRLAKFRVFLPIEAWLKWAREKALPAMGPAFAEFRKDMFQQPTPRDGEPFLTYRSFTDALRFIKARKARLGDNDPMSVPDDHFTRARVAGAIGEAAMVEFYAFAATFAELPKISEIVADPTTAKIPPLRRMDAQYAAAHLVMSSVTAGNINQLWTYSERLVRELQATIIKQLTDSTAGGILLNSPAIAHWIADPANKALLANTFAR